MRQCGWKEEGDTKLELMTEEKFQPEQSTRRGRKPQHQPCRREQAQTVPERRGPLE